MNHPSLRLSLLLALLLPACGGSSAVGTYALDPAAVKDAMKASMPQDPKSPAEDRKAAEEMVDQMIAKMKIELTLKGDNTFSFDMNMGPMAGGKGTATGTYRIDGDKLAMTTLEQGGKKKEKPEEMTATIKGGAITLDPQPGMKMPLTLKKK